MRLHEFMHLIIGRLTRSFSANEEMLELDERLIFLDVLRAHFDDNGELQDVKESLLIRIYCLDCESGNKCPENCDIKCEYKQ